MALSTLLAFLQDTAPATGAGAQSTVRIVAGVLALVLVGIIVMRRRGGRKKEEEDEF